MRVISLGGVGGCQIAGILRKLNYLTYPYDWLISSQSFVIDSFLDINNFFNFKNDFVYDTTKLLSPKFNAIMIHDFNNYILEEIDIINKYKRRFERLYSSLEDKEPILFIRAIDNLSEPLVPENYYNNIYIRENESINRWEEFINMLSIKYKKNIYLLLIVSDKEMIYNNLSDRIFITYNTSDNSIADEINKILKIAI
jgi:hypothetical protein